MKCLLTISIQWFLYTVIKVQVVNQAVLNSSSLPCSFNVVCMYGLSNIMNQLFQGRNPILHCKFSQVST